MIELPGEKIILKEMSLKDAPIFHKLAQHPDLNKYSGPYTGAISVEKAEEYIKNCKIKIENKESYCLGIYLKGKENLIGSIGFINLDKSNLNGELGFWMGKEYWGQGYMTEAVKIMTNFCLFSLNFYRVYAYFHELNIGVKRVLEKGGYKFEGELKSATKGQDRYYNELVYGIIKS